MDAGNTTKVHPPAPQHVAASMLDNQEVRITHALLKPNIIQPTSSTHPLGNVPPATENEVIIVDGDEEDVGLLLFLILSAILSL